MHSDVLHQGAICGAGARGFPNAFEASGTSLAVAAARLSFVLGLRGAAISYDTTCSSAIVALRAAAASGPGGSSELALAAGVHVVQLPHSSGAFAAASMLSKDGRCKAFDVAANGYVRAEGAGACTLIFRAGALPFGMACAALLRIDSCLDGKRASLTAPNGAAQASLVRRALVST